MKYWEDMQSKYGFAGGDATPPEAEACRNTYVMILNSCLRKHGSSIRVVPWDRGGVHNSILIVTIPADLLTANEIAAWNDYLLGLPTMASDKVSETADKIQGHFCVDEQDHQPDDGWLKAWNEACDVELDEYGDIIGPLSQGLTQ